MTTEDRTTASAGSRLNWRARASLVALVVVLAMAPTIVLMSRGVPFSEAILGIGNWIVGGFCVLGGRIYLARERSR